MTETIETLNNQIGLKSKKSSSTDLKTLNRKCEDLNRTPNPNVAQIQNGEENNESLYGSETKHSANLTKCPQSEKLLCHSSLKPEIEANLLSLGIFNNCKDGKISKAIHREGDSLNFGNKNIFVTSVKNDKKGSHVNFPLVKDEIIPCESSSASEACVNLTTSLSTVTSSAGMTQFQETYLYLLIAAADELIAKGITSNEESSSSQCEMKIKQRFTTRLNDDDSNSSSHSYFHKKCENKICGVPVKIKSNIIQAKIIGMKSRSLWLCLPCYQAWKCGHYCYYCNLIYREFSPGTQAFIDSKTWIQCDYCQNWQHMQCEEERGKYHDIAKLNQDPTFKYICPMCRKCLHEDDSDSVNGKSSQKKRSNNETNKRNKQAKGSVDGSPNRNNEFLNLKTKGDMNMNMNMNMNADLYTSNSKPRKKRAIEGNKNKQTILNYDTRDIFHDFYKIANLEEKKIKLELNQ